MTPQRKRLIVLGTVGQMPLAGAAWQALHYLEGFRRLGFDVFYIEDTGVWPYDPERNTVTGDCTYTVGYLSRLMTSYGLSDRWAYRAAAHGDRTFGLSALQVRRLLERADALVNLGGATVLREEYLLVPIRIYLETDPVLPEIEIAKGNAFYADLFSAHTHHFTYGENLGSSDCKVPVDGLSYRPTRQPIVLDWWEAGADSPLLGASGSSAGCFTTIANWRQSEKDVEWRGDTYMWSKHHEFLKFMDLPRRTAQSLELALAVRGYAGQDDGAWIPVSHEDAEAIRLLRSYGWRVANGIALSKEILPYRDYILSSRGEFTVAKDQNVRLRSGWFSDRSACYLAAGRPVVTQDTGFGKFLSVGEGLFSFRTMEEIVAALDAIHSDYERHSRAARSIAHDDFKAETVLAKLAQDSGL